MENWKDIKGYEGHYQVSNKGRVKSLPRIWKGKTKKGDIKINHTKGKILKPYTEKGKRSNIKDSLYVTLCKNNIKKRYYIHRLVAQEFIFNDNPLLKIEVNHKDGNRYNNNADNLEWVTKQQNIKHAFKNNLIKTQKAVNQIDINTNQIINTFISESEACRVMGVSQGKIGRAIKRNGTCKGYKWEYVIESVETIETT